MNYSQIKLCIVLLLLAKPAVPVFAQQGNKEASAIPNVLFIVVDDLRPELGVYGNKFVKTPHMDRLAENSTVFLNAYCQQAVCAPSRTSVLTGLRPNTTKVWDLNTHFRATLPDVVTLPQYFKQNGYLAQCIGKIYHDPAWAQDSLSWSAPEIMAITDEESKYVLESNRFSEGKDNKPKGPHKAAATEAADVPDNAYIDGAVAEAALAFLGSKKSQPFFLAIGFRRPHLPFSAPKKYWDIYNRDQLPLPINVTAPNRAPELALHSWSELRGYRDIPKVGEIEPDKARELIHAYYASISFIDAQIGKLIDALKSAGNYDRTLIVLWSDHGFHLGEKSLWAKTTNYELDARVPLIVKAPGAKKAVKTASLVELVDLYPTLAELSGLPVPEKLDGESFASLLKGSRKIVKSAAYTQFPRPAQFKERPSIMGYSVRTTRYRYTEWQDFQTGEVRALELYDHRKDGDEMNNVADHKAYAKVIKQLSKLLNQKKIGAVSNRASGLRK